MLETHGKLDWEVNQCDPDFIDELQARRLARAEHHAIETKRQAVRDRLNARKETRGNH